MCSSRYAAASSSCERARERAVEVDAVLAQRVGQRDPVAIRAARAARPGRSSSLPPPTSRTASGRSGRPPRRPRRRAAPSAAACPSSASRRSTSTPASTFRQPSSQPPFGTESMCPPITSTRSDAPRQREPLVARLVDRLARARRPRPSRAGTRAPAPTSPSRRPAGRRSASPVSACSSRSSATVREGSSGTRRGYNAASRCGNHTHVTDAGAAATNESRVAGAARRVGVGVLVVAALWGFWEGYKWLWETTGWTWPFAVDDGTMPHLYDVFARVLAADDDRRPAADPRAAARDLVHRQGGARRLPARRRDRLRARRRCSRSRACSSAGSCPYIVASQTVPILAVAPMVVVGLGSKGVAGLEGRRDPRGVPHVLPGRDQHAARPALRRPARASS